MKVAPIFHGNRGSLGQEEPRAEEKHLTVGGEKNRYH